MKVGLICDTTLESPSIGPLKAVAGETCAYETTYSGPAGCASLDISAIWDLLNQYSWLWGILLLVGGGLLCAFGRIFFRAAIFLATTLLVIFAILLLFYTTFLSDTTEAWVFWLVLGISLFVGLLAGYFMMKIERLGAALLAAWGGFMIGVLVNEMALYKVGSPALFWCVCLACAAVAAILTFVIYNHVLIIMTAFIGGYAFWRGISMYAGGFPNEFTLAEEIKAGSIDSITPWFYAYLVAIVVTAGLGAFVQYKQLDKMTEEEKHPYNKLK